VDRKGFRLPPNLRKLTVAERRERLSGLPGLEAEELAATSGEGDLLDLADVMVEAAVGFFPVPIGVVTGLPVDGAERDVPLAVEEPSVVAAATYAGRLLRASGGIETWASEPVMTAQVFLEGAREGHCRRAP
jgi:hydroxymethylglutaryl-CoA reductase